MDFDGFLVLMRIELDGVERAAAPLWEIAERAEAGEIGGQPQPGEAAWS